jgi:hypothetical protein
MRTIKHNVEEIIVTVLAIVAPIVVVYAMVGILTLLQHVHF